MDGTKISTQVSVKHCFLCQRDTEYYCYGCRQDLCIQCKELHVIDLSTKNHEVTRYIERMKYPPKDESEESGDPDSRDSSEQVKSARSGNSDHMMNVRSRNSVSLPVRLSPSELSEIHEIERRQYSERISDLRGETIYNRLIILKGVGHDLKTGHKTVTIRGLSMAGMIGQVPNNEIDDVLAGDLEDRCIIQKTRMTRHMTRLLRYVHRYEQLNDIMVKKPIKFLRIMTRKHDSLKIEKKLQTQKDQEKLLTQRGKNEMFNMVVNLMKGMRLVETGKRQAPGTELLLTLMSSPVLQKSLSVTGVRYCYHISCVTPGRVWVSDYYNIILTDTATGKQLHSVKDSLDSLTGKHTVNCDSELIYIDNDKNINKLSSDLKTTATLIKHTDKTWTTQCVYCSSSSGDLLVGMFRDDTRTGKVMRYDNTGKRKQTIPHNNNTPHDLYRNPWYITENNNGDVLVSDFLRAVVVTSGEGVHRFAYTGPPSGSRLFYPVGICTDVMSHILVSDWNTDTVQMLDRDGQFLSYLLTTQSPGIHGRPHSLSYDVTNHVLWVGTLNNNTLSVYRYINRHLALSDTREHSDVSLSSEPFNSRHIPGLTQEEFDRQKEEKQKQREEEEQRQWEEKERQRKEKNRQLEEKIRRLKEYMSDLRKKEEKEEKEEEEEEQEEEQEQEQEQEEQEQEQEQEEQEQEEQEQEDHLCCSKCNLI
uniref:Uncharacterized protein LOC111133281 isoform X1 n=1 Tax=Crassostrea virginica TaxID=6565 RepID=A0A8B8EAS1_CRAVI|nr:uncharacterized protein LOC111133281 isoform X1 [Crassostrea virginica]XP_022337218.1 uncharacterized protein LOC111133281 isoform X1 [Crassostrea virginica]XP_022337220.1 uncharacterized protein LOC111133281 isoform X1 [Crassostrea virginica]XP_022337221.1 uncharacterized protein LOC111133281 isoform X1 [Crassostrea virginica]XP_022337222.1 uncharacterized protein LOC111133281 isoform X1 [Crassostrea virginica]XP_022337223.1 uncharacterized protein LOC111133281 isoform X1 [Crassostrea virg